MRWQLEDRDPFTVTDEYQRVVISFDAGGEQHCRAEQSAGAEMDPRSCDYLAADELVDMFARVRAMIDRIEYLADPQMDLDWFQNNIMRSRVAITLTDGLTLEASTTFPDDKPKYGREQLIGKLVAMSDGLLSAARVQQIVATVDWLETLAGVSVLARLLCASRG